MPKSLTESSTTIPICSINTPKSHPMESTWLHGIWTAVPNLPTTTTNSSPASSSATLVEEPAEYAGHFPLFHNGGGDAFGSLEKVSRKSSIATRTSSLFDDDDPLADPQTKQRRWIAKVQEKAELARLAWIQNSRSESLPATTPKPRRLNSDALPFVPITRAESIPPPDIPLPPPPPPPALPLLDPLSAQTAWYPAFSAGCETDDPREQELQATLLIDGRLWNPETLGYLAQQFCCKGVEAKTQEPSPVAQFAKVVFVRLKNSCGEWCGTIFLDDLTETVLGTFSHWWSSDSPLGIAFERPVELSHVRSAVCLAAFIGDLHNLRVVTSQQAHQCLRLLLTELTTLEHIHAIHELITHATDKLWKSKDGKAALSPFIHEFGLRAGTVGDNISVAGLQFGRNEIHLLVVELTDKVRSYAAEDQTPRPLRKHSNSVSPPPLATQAGH
ncbi:hypothetical protein JAAARDRAFT_65895 [Jaapia argillacea MUCL 33604]|uniref:Uncharacterized protein n=1 Tax=Jaapia argillacea MUCL 33604 TaxID=933084 RepID=A0A067QEZ3_9AGAM|nr:hypothetical protein JAAARDRAFT_65895 [Jaapia argillacea MUCL 33604]